MITQDTPHKRRWAGWFLSLLLLTMSLSAQASWQCLDGHLCPPGCTMQHGAQQPGAQGAASVPACCLPRNGAKAAGAAMHCSLCAQARPGHSRIKERCTSPVCVLRVQARPDVAPQSHVLLVFDTTAILLSYFEPITVPEETAPRFFGAPRAPPDRIVVRLCSSRAPPVLL
jgi:hypothetical protein